MVHLRNGNLWTTVDAPDSYDHDELLSNCDIHLAYIGNGQFAELRRKTEPSGTTSITCKTVTHPAGDSGTTIGINCSANENNNRSTTSTTTLLTIGIIKSDPDTLYKLLSRTSHSTHVSTPPNISGSAESSLIKPSLVKLRKLSKADIQLWTMANTSTRSKAPSKVTQIFIPIKPRRAISASVSHNYKKQTGTNSHCAKHQITNHHLSGLEPSINQCAVLQHQFLRSQVAESPGHRKYEKE